MKSKNYYVITEGGELLYVQQTSHPIDVTQQIIDNLCRDTVRRVKNVIPMSCITGDPKSPGCASLTIGASSRLVNMPIFSLNLSTVYLLDGEVLYPSFDSEGPVMPMVWEVPSDMRVFLTVMLSDTLIDLAQYLTAFDPEGRSYRLPLSNLYEDCKLCAGANDIAQGANLVAAAARAWNQFKLSNWQKDLYASQGDAGRLATKSMFRFLPKNEGFEQQRVLGGDWRAHCKKVAVDIITNYITP